jgi:uncharacterized membrane protein YphA (DoxX/SURF4 family)
VGLATWLSLIPGGGQLYTGQPLKAAVFFLGTTGLFAVTFNIPAVTDLVVGWWRPRGGFMVLLSLLLQMVSLLLFVGTFLAALTFWYGSAHDARLIARQRNGLPAKQGGRWWLLHR